MELSGVPSHLLLSVVACLSQRGRHDDLLHIATSAAYSDTLNDLVTCCEASPAVRNAVTSPGPLRRRVMVCMLRCASHVRTHPAVLRAVQVPCLARIAPVHDSHKEWWRMGNTAHPAVSGMWTTSLLTAMAGCAGNTVPAMTALLSSACGGRCRQGVSLAWAAAARTGHPANVQFFVQMFLKGGGGHTAAASLSAAGVACAAAMCRHDADVLAAMHTVWCSAPDTQRHAARVLHRWGAGNLAAFMGWGESPSAPAPTEPVDAGMALPGAERGGRERTTGAAMFAPQ
jgi:hypothetical protein